MLNKSISIAIVDDHPIVLEGLQKLLTGREHISLAGAFTSGGDFLSFIQGNHVDIVLLDITLPDVNGIDLCKEIKQLSPVTNVLALSNHSERSIMMQILQNGGSGYLLKNIAADELMACIEDAAGGRVAFSSGAQEIMARPSIAELKGIPQLTKREKEILHMIASGKTSNMIAEELYLSPLTIETHRKNLMQKFEVKNVAALIKTATEHRII